MKLPTLRYRRSFGTEAHPGANHSEFGHRNARSSTASPSESLDMLQAILTLLGLQLAGDLIADMASVRVPGAVIGLAMLLAGLGLRQQIRGAEPAVPEEMSWLTRLHKRLGSCWSRPHGIMANFDAFATHGIALVAGVLISTAVAVAVTAVIFAKRRVGLSAATTALSSR